MNNKVHRILIVEDDPVVRKFLCMAIDQSPQLSVIASASSVKEGQTMLTQQAADVLLVDLGLPDGSGVTLIRQARACQHPLECMVITAYDDDHHLFQALEAGATGYLLKDALPDNIGHSVLSLLTGDSPISPAIARSVLTSFCKDETTNEPDNPLTERELEVLKMMTKGLLRKAIAQQLAISPHTINAHIRNIYRKLEVNSNMEAIHKAQQMEMISKQ